ncbi:MAG: ParB/RepB/Spo0J family partition protein [Marinagarivorans sp.]|nr:ParB/RepB/Spo0J family partition protein [Marinagarivorans sp.]
MKRKGLGRGLDALLGTAPKQAGKIEPLNPADMPVAGAGPKDGRLMELPVEFMQRGKYQPRRDMQQEALQELANSIKAQGVMQPIVVRPVGEDKYEIIAGERRWRATQLAGLHTIPVVIRDVNDEAAIAMALIENIQREDLNPIEEAISLKRLQDEFELTHQEVADAVGKSRTGVTNLLRLLNLTDEVRMLLEHGDLEMGHARCLLSLPDHIQRLIARQIITRGLSVRQAEALARSAQQDASQPKTDAPKVDTDISQLENGLSEHVGVPVTVQHSAKGRGKLIFNYKSLDELDGILAHLKYRSQ